MTSVLGKIFKRFGNGANGNGHLTKGDGAYARAMAVTDDLLDKMREASQSTDAARSVISDVWAQAHNVPFMTTVYEAVQEAKSGPESRREKLFRMSRVDSSAKRV